MSAGGKISERKGDKGRNLEGRQNEKEKKLREMREGRKTKAEEKKLSARDRERYSKA